jgi:PAS domain S-box-containing protein
MSRALPDYLTQWWTRVEARRRQTLQASALSAEVWEEMQVAWEELRAQEEHLAQQREALAASYEALEGERQRYRELFDLAPDAYFVTDLSGRIQEANQRATTILNVPLSILSGMSMSVFMVADRAAFRALLHTLQAGESVESWEVSVQPRQRAPFAATVNAAPARAPQGQLLGVRWLLRDITQLKQTEEALRQANATLDDQVRERTAAVAVLLQETHHRMKNNFQVIASLLDLHADASADPHVHAVLDACQQRLQAMALIHERVSQAQDPARIDAVPYLHMLATQIFEAYRTEGRPISLALDLETVWMPFETAVPCGIIVNELLSNALKHAFPPGRPGEVAITLRAEGDGRVSLAVQDTGVGLPDGFEASQTPSLGWQLVTLLTAQLNGTLTLESRQGTRVTLTFTPPQAPPAST